MKEQGCRPLFKYAATLGFIGFIPFAPGTMGALCGAVLVFLLKPAPATLLFIGAAFILVGIFTAGVAEKTLGRDSRHIVIDELAGYIVSVLFLPLTPAVLFAGLVLFRIFDILKPPPVKYLERLPGGLGVVMDDVFAGVLANIVLRAGVFLALFP